MIARTALSTATSLRILIPLIAIICMMAVFLKRIQDDSKQNKSAQTDNVQDIARKLHIKLFTAILLGIYLLIYIHLTFTYRHSAKTPSINLSPLWSYQAAFQLTPLKIIHLSLARQILLNILLTVPPGLLLPLLYNRTKHPYLLTAATVLLLSLTTETLQYFTCRGLCETDDVIDNFLGCLLGMAILILGSRLAKPRRKENDI